MPLPQLADVRWRATLPSVTDTNGHNRSAPTLEDIAARAAVSRATASRVLRGGTNVSPQAKEAVLAAARELSYTPNRAARSLVTGRSDSIAFYVDETEDRLFSDPFFLGVLRSSHAAVAGAGMQLVFTVASTTEDNQRFLNYAYGRHVDGVLLLSLHGKDELPDLLESHGIPTVLSGRPLVSGSTLYYVDADNIGGARMATEYLLDSGRQTIATVTGPQDMCAGQDRLAGFEQTFSERQLEFRPELVATGSFSITSGYEAMQHLLEAEPQIDAVFAASDHTAIGAIRAIEASGRKVFDDVAVVGFDDIRDAAATTPALTTIRQPIAEIGRAMTELLLERIAGHDATRATILPVELIRRETA
jgi:DNA-binding LacI/PurR family transcriptional regulator